MDFVNVGVIVGAYGIRGWVKVQPHAAHHLSGHALYAVRKWQLVKTDPFKESAESREVTVLRVKPHRGALIAQCAGYHEREAAQLLKGWQIRIHRADFPSLSKDEYYWVDLIGLQVVNVEKTVLGTVRNLIDNGAHAVLCVAPFASAASRSVREILIPFVQPYIVAVDLDHQQVVVAWQSDWIDGAR